MTGHEIAEAFATLASTVRERDALREQLQRHAAEAMIEVRKSYRQGYENGYAARKRTEGREGNKPYSGRAA